PAVQEARAVEVNDHRMVRRTSLRLENLHYGGRVLGVCAEAIDGLGRKCHELAVAQRLHGALDLDLGSSDDTNHRCDEFYKAGGAATACCGKTPRASRHRVKP